MILAIVGGGFLAVLLLCGFLGLLTSLVPAPPKHVAKAPANVNGQQNNAPAPKPTPAFADLKKDAAALLAIKPSGYEGLSTARFDQVISDLRSIPTGSPNYKEAQKLVKSLETKRSDVAGLGEKPHQSEWDGDVQPVKEYLRRNLNDYDSSEFVEWSPVSLVVRNNVPFWGVRLRLRAKNAFGGYILRDTYYYIRGGQVILAEGLNG